MDVDQHMSRVLDYAAFPTMDQMHAELDDLAAAHLDLVRLRRIGTSRLGEPLRVATIGASPHDAVMGPGSNRGKSHEPIADLRLPGFSRLLMISVARVRSGSGTSVEIGGGWRLSSSLTSRWSGRARTRTSAGRS
ncbi:hypothetical protein AB0B45_37990 [Nonomuraea sp. NPDC049152]|uniref:hypothetical protein n=1 Tax=Nonomuraea sp. NPDC049152 TaxID=3154350 RepID=UPI0034067488